MGFEEARSKTLKQIVETERNSNQWLNVDFMKMVDAKIGLEISEAISELIKSNEKLSDVNNRYTTAVAYLTAALVFVGILQIVVMPFVAGHYFSFRIWCIFTGALIIPGFFIIAGIIWTLHSKKGQSKCI